MRQAKARSGVDDCKKGTTSIGTQNLDRPDQDDSTRDRFAAPPTSILSSLIVGTASSDRRPEGKMWGYFAKWPLVTWPTLLASA